MLREFLVHGITQRQVWREVLYDTRTQSEQRRKVNDA